MKSKLEDWNTNPRNIHVQTKATKLTFNVFTSGSNSCLNKALKPIINKIKAKI